MLNAVDAQAVIECDSKWAADAIEAWHKAYIVPVSYSRHSS